MRDALFSSTLDKPIDDEGAEREVVRKTKAEPARSLMRERREAERTSMKGEDGAKRSAEEGLGMGIDDFAFKPETAGEADDRGGKLFLPSLMNPLPLAVRFGAQASSAAPKRRIAR